MHLFGSHPVQNGALHQLSPPKKSFWCLNTFLNYYKPLFVHSLHHREIGERRIKSAKFKLKAKRFHFISFHTLILLTQVNIKIFKVFFKRSNIMLNLQSRCMFKVFCQVLVVQGYDWERAVKVFWPASLSNMNVNQVS